jgi:hypothetical protein
MTTDNQDDNQDDNQKYDNQDNTLKALESRITKLEKENSYLLEELKISQEEIIDIKNNDFNRSMHKSYSDLLSLVNEEKKLSEEYIKKSEESIKKYEESMKKYEESITKSKEYIKKVDSMQNNIFSIMALFFGIFAFISIDISFTKGIMDRVKYYNNSEFIITFLGIQLSFFFAVYFFLIKPFLNQNTSQASTQQSSKVKNFFIYIFPLLLLFFIFLIIVNYNSIYNFISQKNIIENNPNSQNTSKITKKS